MNSKLEEKLLQYQITNKQELLYAVETILKEEESKKSNEQDIDLIDEAVDAILSLNKVDTDELDLQANILIGKILHDAHDSVVTAKPKKNKAIRIKWLIPVAVIISLLMSATLVAYAMGYDVLGMTSRAFKQLKEKVWYNDENTSIVVSNDNRRYLNYDEMIKNESFESLLWPSQINDNNYTSYILVTDYDEIVQVLCSFNVQENIIEYTIVLSSSLPERDQELVTIGNFDVYICEYENLYQADFNYMGNKYTITAPTSESLENFIETLEEK